LPTESSMICSEHFLEIKCFEDPSFIPCLFPAEIESHAYAESETLGNQIAEKGVSRDVNSVLQKVVERLPVLSVVNPDKIGSKCGQTDTSQLQKAFQELACQVCRQLVAHDSELLIEGTVGVTIDGGARVMLLHFADQVRKSDCDASSAEENIPASESVYTDEGNLPHDIAKIDVNEEEQVSTQSSEDETLGAGKVDYSMKSTPSPAHYSQYNSGLSKVLSDLAQAQQTTVYSNSDVQSNTVDLSAYKRSAETDDNSVSDKPKQQTLLRELLCAPLPPKRPCRPVNTAASTAAAPSIIGEVARPRRPTANSTVLGGLLRTGNYQREPNLCPASNIYDRPKHKPGPVEPGGLCYGSDVHGRQFGGNAVRALLRLASEHAAAGRHDLPHNDTHQESSASRNESTFGNASSDSSLDRRFNVLYRNLTACDVGGTSSQNTTRSNSSSTVCSSSELTASTVKQEAFDPGYE